MAGDRSDAGGAEGRCKLVGFCKSSLAAAAGLSRPFGSSLEALFGVATIGVAVADAGTSAGSDPQSESTSSVLGVDASGEFGFDDSLDNAACSAGAAGLDC